MLNRVWKFLSLIRSWLDAFFDTSEKLYPARLAYTHELNSLAITDFDGRHLHIGEGEYEQVYAVKPTKKRRELGNIVKLGTTRCGKSSAELCQIVDWEGSAIIFDIKREIYPKVAGYLKTRGRLITIDLSRGLGNQYDPSRGIPASGSSTNWQNTSFLIQMTKRRSSTNAPPKCSPSFFRQPVNWDSGLCRMWQVLLIWV